MWGVFLWLFAALIRQAFHMSAWKAKMTTSLICFMLLIMMSDAYLLMAQTSLLSMLFTGILQRDFEVSAGG